MFEEYKDIWVYIEVAKGQVKKVGLELLNPGRLLAEKTGEQLVAVVIGSDPEQAAKVALEYGADRAIIVSGTEYEEYNTDIYAHALTCLAEKYKPSALLIGATNNGRDLGPRVSCRLKTGLTADCTSIALDEESGNVAWTRPAFGGNLMATILCPDTRPQIGTVRPGVFDKPAHAAGASGEIITETIPALAAEPRTKLISSLAKKLGEQVELEEASFIVSGGRGLKSSEGFSYLRDLAEVLGGTVGASRAAVDAGWIPQPHQVGQTGKTVRPKIYIACGISGAIQHIAGMSASDTIIAINKDPKAPIFDVADYGIVGDVFEVLPILTQELKSRKDANM